jgi:trk system potassium uptake protein TrkA
MYIIVAGGGKVGRFLTEALVNDGYEVLLIEKNKYKVDKYTEQLGGVVMQGDACEAQVLNEAGAGRADVVIAVTGDDEDNLVICQMAKRKFNVGKVIARINNPKNTNIFQKLGIDATVSHTEAILTLIAREIPQHSAWQMLHLRRSQNELLNVLIGADSPALAKPITALNLPADAQVLSVIREGKAVSVNPNFVIKEDDELLIFSPHKNQTTLKRILLGS